MKVRVIGLAPIEEFYVAETESLDFTFPCPRGVYKKRYRTVGLAGKLALHLAKLNLEVELLTQDNSMAEVASIVLANKDLDIRVRSFPVSKLVTYRYAASSETSVAYTLVERNSMSDAKKTTVALNQEDNSPLIVFDSVDWNIALDSSIIPEKNFYVSYGSVPQNKFKYGFFHSVGLTEFRKESETTNKSILDILLDRYEFDEVCLLYNHALMMDGVAKPFDMITPHIRIYIIAYAIYHLLKEDVSFKRAVFKSLKDIKKLDIGKLEFLTGF